MTLAPTLRRAAAQEAEAPLRRLLVVNPNSSPRVSALVRATADRVLPPDVTATVIQPEGGPAAIETPAHRQIAEPLALELLSAHRGFDAYVMACFDDIALEQSRRFLGAPVIGAVEASVAFARLLADRFAIVTTVGTAMPGIRRVLRGLGAEAQCSLRSAEVGVVSAARGGSGDARIDREVAAAASEGAGAVILGSAGLTGRAAELQRRHGVQVIDAIEAAIKLAVAALPREAR